MKASDFYPASNELLGPTIILSNSHLQCPFVQYFPIHRLHLQHPYSIKFQSQTKRQIMTTQKQDLMILGIVK